jgi:hypothetical protein
VFSLRPGQQRACRRGLDLLLGDLVHLLLAVRAGEEVADAVNSPRRCAYTYDWLTLARAYFELAAASR